MRHKSEAFGAFRVFKAYAEKALGRKIKMLRDDKGGGYIGKDWDAYCAEKAFFASILSRTNPIKMA